MPVFSRTRVDEQEIAARVAELERRFAPDVVRVRYKVKNDSSGDPAIYFRVLLTDEASGPGRLGQMVNDVRRVIRTEIDPLNNWDLLSYVRFRNQSEQAEMRDAEWE